MLKKIIRKIIASFGYSISKNLKPINNPNEDKNNYIEKLSKEYQKHDTVKLHFGCGPRILKNWLNIDLKYCHYEKFLKAYGDKYYPKKDRGTKNNLYKIDITKTRLPLPNESVDVVFHEDFLEHLDQKGQILFLSETLRVLKKGGIHRVNTPDLLVSMNDNSDFTKGSDGVFVHEWDKHKHVSVMTPRILEDLALMVGYSKVIFTTRDNSTSKYTPLEYRPGPSRPDDGNIFADLIK